MLSRGLREVSKRKQEFLKLTLEYRAQFLPIYERRGSEFRFVYHL